MFIVLLLISSCKNKAGTSGVDSDKALSTFEVPPGFKIELIAAEPLISDPVDMEIDEYGNLYVVEMHGYPLDISGSGNIILLKDTNGDGKMDKRIVFADNLILPAGVMRWKKGILVTDAPNLLYLEDTDNDGKADFRDTVLSGFALSNPQHNTNNPMYGLDNWIYIGHQGATSTREYKEEFGDEGSEIIFPGSLNTQKLPKNAKGLSIRFQPDEKKIETLSYQTQFGHAFDQWGNWFGCNNSNQGYHEVIANRYFQRNKDLVISSSIQSMSDHLNAPEVFPTTTHPDRQLLTDVGVMTSGCGITVYDGGAFPAPYDKNISFMAEPVSNLVHADILKDKGSSFEASALFKNKEFLTSTDAWSRPVNFYVGPDGALYMLDYYRKMIESPEWMSEQAVKAGGLYDGADKGRIYRITAIGQKAAEWTKGLKLGDESTEKLVEHLADNNRWWRTNSQRLLVDRKDRKAVPALIKMAGNPNSTMGRLHALWTLEGIAELSPALIEGALKDNEPGIRSNAIKLAELHLNDSPQLLKSLLALQNDIDPKVRLQLLLTLGYDNSNESATVRNKLLFRDINDKWVQIAALTASSSQTESILKEVLNKYQSDVPAYSTLVQRLATMIANGGDQIVIKKLLQRAASNSSGKQNQWQGAMLEGLATGMESLKSKSPESINVFKEDQDLLVKTFFGHSSELVRKGSLDMLRVIGLSDGRQTNTAIADAVKIIANRNLSDTKRTESINFLALTDPSPYTSLLKNLIVPQEKTAVQLAALKTLSKIPGTVVSDYVLQKWAVLTPEIRDAAIGTFLGNNDRIILLLNAIEKNQVQASSVSFGRSVQLMQNKDDQLRNRARTLFTKSEEDGKKVNQAYQEALELKGDATNGQKVYVQNCAICHQVRGKMGIELGPDLGTIHNWTAEIIMANILDPNISISSGYDLWNVELNNGESHQGIISSETDVAITLRNNGKLEKTISRQDIKEIKSMEISAMPSGLEKKINKQEMADLLAFLRKF
ncbi:PVC-type heme-binding CxxCH protein [Daejeonella sp.]|uniref:PVC-type heme-binding CxxCH protein n=1 Tax=Daejeonella sp. TaxID=2805397 RepID=UPI0027358C75|nr:PVC-type heme-binding CxxCH protein [Daejeonella sp.]